MHQVLCSACGSVATSVEITPPEASPNSWERRSPRTQALLSDRRSPAAWWFGYDGIEGGNGGGDPIPEHRAREFLRLRYDDEYAAVQQLDLYDEAGYCDGCRKPYCRRHWNLSRGVGTCPEGHRRSLDPHWHPYDD